jgi:hypothetical protein
VQHVVHTLDRAARHLDIGQVPLDQLDLRQMREVLALSGDKTVDDADARAAANELFCQMGTDETGAAGHEIVSHSWWHVLVIRGFTGTLPQQESCRADRARPCRLQLSAAAQRSR